MVYQRRESNRNQLMFFVINGSLEKSLIVPVAVGTSGALSIVVLIARSKGTIVILSATKLAKGSPPLVPTFTRQGAQVPVALDSHQLRKVYLSPSVMIFGLSLRKSQNRGLLRL